MKDLRQNSSHDLWLHVINTPDSKKLFDEGKASELTALIDKTYLITDEQQGKLNQEFVKKYHENR